MKTVFSYLAGAFLGILIFVLMLGTTNPGRPTIRIIGDQAYQVRDGVTAFELSYCVNGVNQIPAVFYSEAELARYVEYLGEVGSVTR